MTEEQKYYYILGQVELIDQIKEDLSKIMDEVDQGKTSNPYDLMFDVINLLKKLHAINPTERDE
jgi:hypothetical protein